MLFTICCEYFHFICQQLPWTLHICSIWQRWNAAQLDWFKERPQQNQLHGGTCLSLMQELLWKHTKTSDGCTSMTSDHIINAGDDCLMYISLLLNAIITHEAMPDSFLYSTIPKGRSVNKCDSSNYRGIALSSIYLKIIDNIVLQTFSAFLCTGEL